jgi:hypothetical protein
MSRSEEQALDRSPAMKYAAIYTRLCTEGHGKGSSIPTRAEPVRRWRCMRGIDDDEQTQTTRR